jgi:hypothetical protein
MKYVLIMTFFMLFYGCGRSVIDLSGYVAPSSQEENTNTDEDNDNNELSLNPELSIPETSVIGDCNLRSNQYI